MHTAASEMGDRSIRPSEGARGVLRRLLGTAELPESLFLVALFLFLTSSVAWRAAWSSTLIPTTPAFHTCFHLLIAGLIVLKLVLEGHRWYEWLAYVAVVSVLCVSARICRDRALMWTALFVIGSRGIDLRRTIKVALVPVVTMLVLTIALSFLGLSEGITGVRLGTGEIRPSLGYRGPNGLGIVCYILCAMLGALFWKKRPRTHLVVTVLLLVLATAIAKCRSATICMLLTTALVQLSALGDGSLMRWLRSVVPACCLGLLVLCLGGSLLAMIVLGTPSGPLATVDYLLSFRISLAQAFYDLYPPQLLGRDVFGNPPVALDIGPGFYQPFLVDNGYQHILLRHGIIAHVLLFGSMIVLCVRAVRERHANACLLLMSTGLVYGLLECSPVMITANIYVLALGAVVHGEPISALDLDVERRGDEPPQEDVPALAE